MSEEDRTEVSANENDTVFDRIPFWGQFLLVVLVLAGGGGLIHHFGVTIFVVVAGLLVIGFMILSLICSRKCPAEHLNHGRYWSGCCKN